MGYGVHVTRAEDWTGSEAAPIPLEAWRACVEADPELRWDEAEGYAVWTAHPDRAPEAGPPLVWWEGRVTVKSPDEAILVKMGALAARLDAHLVGDEGEAYPVGERAIPPASARVQRTMEQFAGLTVAGFSKGGHALDFSRESLAILEAALADLHDRHAGGERAGRFEERISGAYLGEVLRRVGGWAWGGTEDDPHLEKGGRRVWPQRQTRARMHDGPAADVARWAAALLDD